MKAPAKLFVIFALLAATPAAIADQPRFRRATKTQRYDPFQEDDALRVHPEQQSKAAWIKPAVSSDELPSPDSQKPTPDRYAEAADAEDGNRVTAPEPPRRALPWAKEIGSHVAEPTFHTVSYEPEYVVEDVYASMPACDPCAPGCGDACCGPVGRPPAWCPRWTAFGEYLLLRPRDFGVGYAVEVDASSTVLEPMIIRPVHDVNPDASSGFRAGLGCYLGTCDMITATFTHFESDDEDRFDSSPAGQLTSQVESLVFFQEDNQDFDGASAEGEVDFQLLDLDYRREMFGVDWFAGIRIAWLDQDFHTEFTEGTTEFRELVTDVDFHGAGLRFGLGREHRDPCLGWLVYARGAGSFLGGRFENTYIHSSNDGSAESFTRFNSDRLVTMFDLEMGFGWQHPSGRLRLTAGYTLSYWFNVVTTGDLVYSIAEGTYNTLGDRSIGFDGLTARAEYRF